MAQYTNQTGAADFQSRFKEAMSRYPGLGAAYLGGHVSEEMIQEMFGTNTSRRR